MFNAPLQRSVTTLLLGLSISTIPSLGHADHAWGNYHWARTADTFTLKLGDNLSNSSWKSMLAKASQDWNSPEVFSTTSPLLTSVVTGSAGRRCSMVAGTTQICSNTYGNNGWLGIATINITSAAHITQGLVKLNDTYFNSSKYNNPNQKLHVMCQEIGHTFGLDHQSTNGSSQNSCMDYFSNTGVNANSTLSTTPNLHDFDQLNIVYSHLDSSNTVAAISSTRGSRSNATQAPINQGQLKKQSNADADADDTENPKNWGQLKKQSKNGRSSTYEKKNTDGSLNITHVYWIEEAAACATCDHRDEHLH